MDKQTIAVAEIKCSIKSIYSTGGEACPFVVIRVHRFPQPRHTNFQIAPRPKTIHSSLQTPYTVPHHTFFLFLFLFLFPFLFLFDLCLLELTRSRALHLLSRTALQFSPIMAHELKLDPKYDHYDFPTTSQTTQSGHPGHTTPEQDAQVHQLRAMLEQAGYTERLDTLSLVGYIVYARGSRR